MQFPARKQYRTVKVHVPTNPSVQTIGARYWVTATFLRDQPQGLKVQLVASIGDTHLHENFESEEAAYDFCKDICELSILLQTRKEAYAKDGRLAKPFKAIGINVPAKDDCVTHLLQTHNARIQKDVGHGVW